jgi:anti-sigma factor RsiW
MRSSKEDESIRKRSGTRSHQEFLELCAVSTSGDLTEKERRELEAHVAGCEECRRALEEFKAAVDLGVPQLVSKLAPQQSDYPSEANEAGSRAQERSFAFAHGNGHRRASIGWHYVWLPFAACIVLSLALATYTYRVGKGHRWEPVPDHSSMVPAESASHIDALERRISGDAHERHSLNVRAAERDRLITELRKQIEQQSAALAQMKAAQANLEQSLSGEEQARQRLTGERDALAQKLDVAQASLQEMQAKLASAEQQRILGAAQDNGLIEQIKDLNTELRDREQTINKEDDLLAHDRDIRDLMGARDLYIAEVYDVGRDATTQKPCGRVFYTKGKSLVFYAYDLDKQPGARDARTFQAWGRRGADMEQALSLGIFYQDSAAKKRWVLKVDDAKTLEQIDAVFVTVEPNGPSQKPSGKPLLFAYLKIDPNHP